jgi:quinol monooxygenase YgiN
VKFKSTVVSAFIVGVTLSTSAAYAADGAPDIKVSPNGEVAAIATIEVKPGSEGAFEKAALLSIKCSRLEPGNASFTIEKILDAGNTTYIMAEVWRNKAALQSHFYQPYTQALFGTFKQTAAAPPSIKFAAELTPAHRSAPVKTDPKKVADCR